jgi:regulator of nonsense transcripts 1
MHQTYTCMCRYCGQHSPATVAQCEVTGKWFCNGHVNAGGTCIVQHLVRGRYKEVLTLCMACIALWQ